MTESAGRRIQRVLVALDSSPGALAAAASAARLAATLEAELTGLFVEDHDLLRLGEAPQAHQVAFLTAVAERLEGEAMRRQLRAQASRARRLLDHLAAREGVACSFRVARGRVSTEILAATGGEDLVSVGRVGWSHGRRGRLGSTARALLERRGARVLMTERGTAVAPPVAVLFDGGGAAAEALDLAARLAPETAGGLIVLAAGPEARRLAAGRLGSRAAAARFEELPAPPGPAIASAARSCRAGLLVLPLGGPGLEDPGLQHLLAELRCPVLTVS